MRRGCSGRMRPVSVVKSAEMSAWIDATYRTAAAISNAQVIVFMPSIIRKTTQGTKRHASCKQALVQTTSPHPFGQVRSGAWPCRARRRRRNGKHDAVSDDNLGYGPSADNCGLHRHIVPRVGWPYCFPCGYFQKMGCCKAVPPVPEIAFRAIPGVRSPQVGTFR